MVQRPAEEIREVLQEMRLREIRGLAELSPTHAAWHHRAVDDLGNAAPDDLVRQDRKDVLHDVPPEPVHSKNTKDLLVFGLLMDIY